MQLHFFFFFLGVFNSCLRPKRIRSDVKSTINQFITYIADKKKSQLVRRLNIKKQTQIRQCARHQGLE